MIYMKNFIYFIFFHWIIATPQLNLYYTDWMDQSQDVNNNCLRVPLKCERQFEPCEIISYCMHELPSKLLIEDVDHLPQLTFSQLAQQNITSYQLYLWSAPIDTIERYQLYLNDLSSFKNEIFYNCTLPRFGPQCQYQLYYHQNDHSSLNNIIFYFYFMYPYIPTTFTCYTHLECNRGPSPSCLDWTEICDGKIDCLNDGVDEEHCWQLEITECNDDEYRCMNGQCISRALINTHLTSHYCLDLSDSSGTHLPPYGSCSGSNGFTYFCEDRICKHNFLTSSCVDKRNDLLIETMYSSTAISVSDDCWSAFKHMFYITEFNYISTDELSQAITYIEIVMDTCPELFLFPNGPILFGDIYFAYAKNDSSYLKAFAIEKFYVCYNNSRYDHYFINASKISFNNMTCINFEQFISPTNPSNWILSIKTIYREGISKVYNDLSRYHFSFHYNSTICNRTNMYQCINSSKCISKYRLMDAIYDCPHMDDENRNLTADVLSHEQINKYYFKCPTTNKYIPQTFIQNQDCDCGRNEYGFCDDEHLDALYIQRNILFQHICDGFIDLLPILIEGRNETDETECQQWECNNLYTRCNDRWNCPNGLDETGCTSYSSINCSLNYHYCVSSDRNQLFCLPVEKANDGHIDCLGATDESSLCRRNIKTTEYTLYRGFYCMNYSIHSCMDRDALCNNLRECENGDDEQVCSPNRIMNDFRIYEDLPNEHHCDVEDFLRSYQHYTKDWSRIYFQLSRSNMFIENTDITKESITPIFNQHEQRCHLGLDLFVWSNNTSDVPNVVCLCPSMYYGDQCQYQNQRISLIIKFRALSDSWQTLFAIVISLMDDTDQRIVHSYEQITYLWLENCNTEYHMYLLYATRPKDLRIKTTNYSIHIDIYEKNELKYRGSLLLPVKFSFLPVHRLVYFVDIPRSDEKRIDCLINPCIHGQCIRYSNNSDNATFCQCAKGWTGRYCTIERNSNCPSESKEIGVLANHQSICVCPLHRFGPRCLLTDPICLIDKNSSCQHGGTCIPLHDFMIPRQDSICICPEGFSGKQCEIVDNKIILSFNKEITLPQTIFFHFFHLPPLNGPLMNTTTFRTIPIQQDSITIHWTQSFHLLFIEIPTNNYYLAVSRTDYNQSEVIKKTIHPSDHCPHITKLFNQTFSQLHLIRRVKYYHLPCQNQSLNLSCFYDHVHLCLCYQFGQKRLANCFNFAHNTTFDCVGRSECENNAQCFQNKPDCATRFICRCPTCYYGRRCQFNTNGFSLSLDGILGYHILPNVTLPNQPAIVKFSLSMTIIFIILGFVDGILCIMTFKNRIVREVGCGLYLLCSSIMTLFIMTVFGLKFFILLAAQMTLLSNRVFLVIQCHSLDFVLRVCLNMDQWLNACVAVERAYTVIQGASFVKKKTQRIAKIIILLLMVISIGSFIHDPIYRDLINEEENTNEARLWCIVRYSSGLQFYNSVIQIIHFFGPFLINIVSSITLIMRKSRQQANLHIKRHYKDILQAQIQEHKSILIAPFVLVMLGIPRLIITFASGCMKSANHSWLFLIGYFISFIPSMLTFIVFIMPSKFYTEEFKKSLAQVRTTIQRYLHLTSSQKQNE